MALARFERDGALGIVSLTSPPLNLVGYELAQDLIAVTDQARAETGLRAILLRAEGEAFSAGADVNMFRGRTPETGRDLLNELIPALRVFEELPYPTVAAVQGLCLAGGFELVLGADLIWASDDAQFGLVEAVIGAMPFGGGTHRLAMRAGVARAREAVFSARIYDAKKMLEWGVINRIVSRADLDAKTREFAQLLAKGPTRAYAGTKRTLRAYSDQGLAAADALLPDVGGEVMASNDVQNGLRSLLEKGPGNATFEG